MFLVSEASGLLTGEILHVDGRWTLKRHSPLLDGYEYSTDRERG